jgi:CO/xanthine dehydrogenase FAD-binding subunit
VPLVAAYHRPTDITEALDLLASPGRIPLAGGTVINADRRPSSLEAVDLQALSLDSMSVDGDVITLGAMLRLDEVMELSDDLLAEAARRELPSTLRTVATVGGTIGAADPDSTMLAALLVSGTIVHYAQGEDRSLAEHLASPSGLIISVSLSLGGAAALETTGRTPMDTPIVAAAGRRFGSNVLLALTGVGPHPVLVDAADPTRDLAPPGDFRGSAAYRLHLATTLSARVMEALA